MPRETRARSAVIHAKHVPKFAVGGRCRLLLVHRRAVGGHHPTGGLTHRDRWHLRDTRRPRLNGEVVHAEVQKRNDHQESESREPVVFKNTWTCRNIFNMRILTSLSILGLLRFEFKSTWITWGVLFDPVT